MFTGLIEATGSVEHINMRAGVKTIGIKSDLFKNAIETGSSIALSGVCQTVTMISGTTCFFDVCEETLATTTLGNIRARNTVNLERAIEAAGRLDGHIVTGHVDSTGRIIRTTRRGVSIYLSIKIDARQSRFCVPRGSIAVDGISLTIASAANGLITVQIIPHTSAQTTLAGIRRGSIVNIETDYLVKSFQHMTNKTAADRDKLRLLADSGYNNGGIS